MAQSSILGGQRVAPRARGRDIDALGPSDSSDSGSDVHGERLTATAADMLGDIDAAALLADLSSDTDASGTGERASAVPDGVVDGADIGVDRIQRRPTGRATDALDAADVSLDDPEAAGIDELAVDESDAFDDPDRAAEADRLDAAGGP